MDALILFSHGSLLCGAGETLKEHAKTLQSRGDYSTVEVGFLNYSRPTFDEASERCMAAGAERVVVVPYFSIPGYFVKVDLPRHVAAVQASRPEATFVVAEALGYHPLLADAVLGLAEHSRPHEHWRDDLARAGAFCEADPECPLYGTPRCPRVPGRVTTADGRRPATDLRVSVEGKDANGDGQAASGIPNDPTTQRPDGPKTALLLLVHGTPKPASNAPMWQVVEEIRSRGMFALVEVGFMECNEPDIPTAVQKCIDQGAQRVTAVPYFLHTGKHVADDLPTAMEEAQARYPDVEFRMGEFLGRAPEMADLLALRASGARGEVLSPR